MKGFLEQANDYSLPPKRIACRPVWNGKSGKTGRLRFDPNYHTGLNTTGNQVIRLTVTKAVPLL